MATRTTTTRTTRREFAPSADLFATAFPPADFLFSELVQAYFDCRRRKRNSRSALEFELNLESNLVRLDYELRNHSYQPGPSVCFVVTRPKAREVWAAQFRDRIVHHLLYNKIGPRFERQFIADSCACIPERGTLYAAKRLEQKVRSITDNWQHPAYYLKCDLANFFVTIDKPILFQLLAKHIPEPWWQELTKQVLFNDPRENHHVRGQQDLFKSVPPHKRLTHQNADKGLPIGNLSSQFFANVYLNELDQFVKHRLRAQHYIRYVDDFILLHESARWLNSARQQMETFLAQNLKAQLNPRKTIIQPISRGVDFVGQVIKPWRRVTRAGTVKRACSTVLQTPDDQLRDVVNSYYGLLRQASHNYGERVRLTRAVFKRGKAVDKPLTKIAG